MRSLVTTIAICLLIFMAVRVSAGDVKQTSTYSLPLQMSQSELDAFYQMGLDEYYKSNYGLCVEIFEALLARTDKYHYIDYYLAKIYKEDINLHDADKSKEHSLNFIEIVKKKKLDVSYISGSYDDLIDLEEDATICMKYAREALGISENLLSRQCMAKASEKMYAMIGDKKYKDLHILYLAKNSEILDADNIIDAGTPQLNDNYLRVADK
jgi:hypothetical protein